jgi:FAM91 N-terminus
MEVPRAQNQQNFIMKRVSGEHFENLLYKVFVVELSNAAKRHGLDQASVLQVREEIG